MDDQGQGPLSLFHPVIAQWFLRTFGQPTDVQARAWPEIASGSHVLVAAPTGTGKTLAAFLWGINQLARGVWKPGTVRILYISPLKALNNDIQRNLIAPLDQVARAFEEAGEKLPAIRVLTRSGDTPPSDRRRMLRTPPEILITTPESLNLLLATPPGRSMLSGLATVILDEIHAVAATKRGTHLITAVDRLVLLSGEFQRVALSATVKPLSAVADLVGGFVLERGAGGAGAQAAFTPRRVRIVDSPVAKRYEISISFPAGGFAGGGAAAAQSPPRSSPDLAPGPRSSPDLPPAPRSSPDLAPADPVFEAVRELAQELSHASPR